jgi:4a-hydroxytetrahydrobiopterin dehydratase
MDGGGKKRTDRIDTAALDPERCNELLEHLKGWDIEATKGVMHLVKVYVFSDFASALLFANQVGNAAELEGHHPSMMIEWGKITVRWWTHRIGGVGDMDFIMAARCDELVER